MKKLGITGLLCAMAILIGALYPNSRADAAVQQTVYNSPYVTFSPDGQAWTTNAGDKNYIWYDEGTTVYTGISSSLRAVATGEHYYTYNRSGTVPLGKWVVELRRATCIHSNFNDVTENIWHGVSHVLKICGKYYFSGWMAYCADCGQNATSMYVYMSREAAESIDYLDVGVADGHKFYYYYLCPWNNNLEQGREFEPHQCKAVSPNRYKINYNANTSETYGGFMASSIHICNNATEYEGQKVTPITHLTKNAYTRIGYEFVGWNTEPNGNGMFYADGEEILNLCTADYGEPATWTDTDQGEITLYAQWRASAGILRIDPNSGKYEGNPGISTISGKYGSAYYMDSSKLTPPKGYTVFFLTNGGEEVPPIIGTTHFTEWSQVLPFQGRVKDNYYYFNVPDGNVDTIKAGYALDPIILPTPEKDNSSFGGWYYDPKFEQPAGGGGDTLIPDKDMTLYAQWVELTLYAEDDYLSNGGKGAVDLSWSQPDGQGKNYLIYQSRDGDNWICINAAEDTGKGRSVNISASYSGTVKTYTVPYTGLYTLTADGAQGGNYVSHKGGLGGHVSGEFWLQAGEIITYNIGGQNGYNGGGLGDIFANGGGSTIVSTNLKGTVLVAGGGGSATSEGVGGAGGSSASLVKGGSGQNGGAGGGGGYQGGSAGEYIRHYHTDGCYHAHTGESSKYGGCYNVRADCGSTSFESTRWKTGFYYGNIADDGSHQYCVRCGSDYCSGHDVYSSQYVCNSCGEIYKDRNPGICSKVYYVLGCNIPEGYFCGYSDGQVLSSRPAYGGSNYVNTAYTSNYTNIAGTRTGNGCFTIKSELIGFVDQMKLDDVIAADQEKPDGVLATTVKKEAITENQVKITWDAPRDNGTTYYHMVESYLVGSTALLCSSNITKNTLVTGIKGYYTLVDGKSNTIVTAANSTFSEQAAKVVSLLSTVQYLHVAAVDRAGNIGSTTHICLDRLDTDLQWPLYTRQLKIEEGDNVYASGNKTYYVRSDGGTPFTLDFQAYMDGAARENYQINYAIFESNVDGNTVRNILQCSGKPIREEEQRLSSADLSLNASGESLLSVYPWSEVWRKSACSELEAMQMYTLGKAADGVGIEVVPIAGADYQWDVVYSDYEADKRNGITLIGDAIAPVIRGMEVLESLELLDRRNGTVTLYLTAEDALSGVREFYLEIYNSDNAILQKYTPEADGSIRIDITQDDPIFSGDFIATAYAVDNVGNISSVSAGTTEFALTAEVSRILEPHDPIFKRGESGILTITTWGYADRVEVEFPEGFQELNQTYDYTDTPSYCQEEKLQFMIPLYVLENENYEITVRAYKGDRKLEEHPAISVIEVSGTVLDEIRTRLR